MASARQPECLKLREQAPVSSPMNGRGFRCFWNLAGRSWLRATARRWPEHLRRLSPERAQTIGQAAIATCARRAYLRTPRQAGGRSTHGPVLRRRGTINETMRIVILGLSITSSWGNGHATTYRGLVRGLVAAGPRRVFPGTGRPLVCRAIATCRILHTDEQRCTAVCRN